MSNKNKTAIIIGSGFGGLGSACILSKAGWDVQVFEKNEQIGGRASLFTATKDAKGVFRESNTAKTPAKNASGFTFDAGPSWYLMPDIFEHFFDLIGEKVDDHLTLQKLSPSYRIFYKDSKRHVDIYSDLKKDLPTIKNIEPGAEIALKQYLKTAGKQYEIAKDKFLYKNYDSFKDFFTWEVLSQGRKLNALTNMDKYVRSYFKTDEMYKIIQYPSVFLGSSPYKTPALYSMMNHIDFNMGVFYPRGGIYEVVRALEKIAKKNATKFHVNSEVKQIIVKAGRAIGVELTNGKKFYADHIVSNANVWHTETKLLQKQHRTKSPSYWKKRVLAPSALIMYLGVNKTFPNLKHHNLVFSKNWKKNFAQIFDDPSWPDDPSLYVCAPSKTDPDVAPKGHENLFVLVPIAAGLDYSQKQLDAYTDKILDTIQDTMKLKDLKKHIVYKKLFSVKDFAGRYHAQEGTALGMAHILKQTAVFRPHNTSKKVQNLFFVGADVNPGIGMPITLISAELMYKRLIGDKTSGPLKKL